MAFRNPVRSLPASAITSGTFSGTYTLTGSLQTGGSNPRVTVDSSGINAYNAGGTNTLKVASSDGSVTVTGGTITGGTIQTAITGARVVMTSALSGQLSIYTGDARETNNGSVTYSTLGNTGSLVLNAPNFGTTAGQVLVQSQDTLNTHGPRVLVGGDLLLQAQGISTGALTTAGALTVQAGGANITGGLTVGGQAWDTGWATYTPTVSGFTNVSLTATGYYKLIGKTCFFRIDVKLTAVTTLGSAQISVSLPATASATMGTPPRNVTAQLRTNGGVYVAGVGAIGNNGTTIGGVYIATPNGATPNLGTWTGANPAGQVAGDEWSIWGVYETA